MKKILVLILFLTSCYTSDNSVVVQAPSPKKQKQKIVHLQKKLELAEKEQKKTEREIDRISAEICKAKLNLIRKQLDDFEKKDPHGVEPSTLFLTERESLHEIIQDGP